MEKDNYMISVRGYSDLISKGNKNSLKTKIQQIPINTLCENMSEFTKGINQMLDAMENNIGSTYQLDELEVHAEITFTGSVNLIGELSTGTVGGITLKFKRK